MSYFPGMKLTKQGEQLLAKVNGNLNETINFKRAELGSGKIDSLDEIRFLTALKEKWKNVSISDCKVVDGEEVQVQLEIQFDNADFTKDMLLNEIGIYAAGKDDIEVLFAYTNALDRGEDLPIAKDNPQSFIINVLIGITSATKVDAVIDLNSYVSLRKLKEELDKKEDKISLKNTAFNKNFGLLEGEVLEGHRLAQALGLEFAGELNNDNLKQAGKAYWDNVNKSIYKCLVDNTLNYAESTKFEALSNHDLLLKLQNLTKITDVFLIEINPDTPAGTRYMLPFNANSYKKISVIAYEIYHGVTTSVNMEYQSHWNLSGIRAFRYHLLDKYSLFLEISQNNEILIKENSVSLDRKQYIYRLEFWGELPKN